MMNKCAGVAILMLLAIFAGGLPDTFGAEKKASAEAKVAGTYTSPAHKGAKVTLTEDGKFSMLKSNKPSWDGTYETSGNTIRLSVKMVGGPSGTLSGGKLVFPPVPKGSASAGGGHILDGDFAGTWTRE